MKENVLKTITAAAIGGFLGYIGKLYIPLILLIAAMIMDYVTGMIKAYVTATLSSKIGFKGILKKLSYLLVVGVAMLADYLINTGLSQIGVASPAYCIIGVIVIIWLIINEMLSIIENLSLVGVPMPAFLKKIIEKLKITVENKIESEQDNGSKNETEQDNENKKE